MPEGLSLHHSESRPGLAAIGDFVNWACSLDQQLDSTDATYAARRDTDDDGRVLPASALCPGQAEAPDGRHIIAGVLGPVVRCEPEASYHPDTDLLATLGGLTRTSSTAMRQ